jgi:Lon protease-like protein
MTNSGGDPAGGQVLSMFPLGSVLFPGMPLPLQVFEERYVRMIEQCVSSGSGFGVVLIERGSEVGGGDVRSDLGTLAVIENARRLPDGTWSVAARGTRRLRIAEWLKDAPYPRAVVAGWDEQVSMADPALLLERCTGQLSSFFAAFAATGSPMRLDFSSLSADLSEASWQLCSISPVGSLDRQKLLACPDPVSRLELLSVLLIEQQELLDLGGDSSGESE